jgi:hypothetical protein
VFEENLEGSYRGLTELLAWYFPQGTEERHETPKDSPVPAEIRTKHLPNTSLEQRFPNASRFVVGREKILKCDFFYYVKIKNRKKWESEKTK